MTLSQIRTLIQALPGVSSWELRRLRKKSYQRYLVFDRLDSQRVVETENYTAILYKIYQKEGQDFLGESVISLAEGDRAAERLARGWEMASLVANPLFELPEKGLDYEQVPTFDNEVRSAPFSFLDRIQEDLIRTPLKKVRRSSAEIFIEDKEILLSNSKGLELEEKRTEILVDFVLLAEKGPLLEGECLGSRRAVFYDDLKLAGTVDQYAAYSRDSLGAVLPRSGLFPVVFSGEALDSLFHFFCLQASGPARFQNWSHFRVGHPVLEDLQGEALTLSSNPSLPGGLKTRGFDDNGLPLRPVRVIEDNIFQKPMNSKRYADYLNEEATGDFANLEIASGSTPCYDLLNGSPCFHLLRFSHFEPNPVTGAFSAEIRTGYYLMNGQKNPIKGGAVSGGMQQAFRKAFFSQERTQRETYAGPEAIRIESLNIAGS